MSTGPGPVAASVAPRLIDAAFPAAAVGASAGREKSVRRGHPSTLHLWWSRKPIGLAASVLFAQIVADPGSGPERDRLLALAEGLADWDRRSDELLWSAARREVASALVALDAGTAGHLDPFCGAGSLALAASRLGLDVLAADLSPVAARIASVTMGAAGRDEGFGERVRRAGRLVRDGVAADLGVGDHERPAVRLWVRTDRCDACGAEVPLLRSWVLRRGARSDASLVVDHDEHGRAIPSIVAELRTDPAPLARGRTCGRCGDAIDRAALRARARAGRLGLLVVAEVRDAPGGRVVVAPDPSITHPPTGGAVGTDLPSGLDAPVPDEISNLPTHGIERLRDVHLPGQAAVLGALHARIAGLDRSDGVAEALTLALGRTVNRGTAHGLWNAQRGTVEQAFSLNAGLPMTWLFPEADLLGTGTGSFLTQVDYVAAAIEAIDALRRVGGPSSRADVRRGDARAVAPSGPCVVSTDPPFHDLLRYGDLSGLFEAWTEGLPSAALEVGDRAERRELVPDGDEPSSETWVAGMAQVLGQLIVASTPGLPATVYFAHRRGRSRHGWVHLLDALLRAEISVSGAWPLATERSSGLRSSSTRTSLAASVVLVCRPVVDHAGRVSPPVADIDPEVVDLVVGRARTAGLAGPDLDQAEAAGVLVSLTRTASDDAERLRRLDAARAWLDPTTGSNDSSGSRPREATSAVR